MMAVTSTLTQSVAGCRWRRLEGRGPVMRQMNVALLAIALLAPLLLCSNYGRSTTQPTTQPAGVTSEDQLRAALAAAKPGSTITISGPIYLSDTLTIQTKGLILQGDGALIGGKPIPAGAWTAGVDTWYVDLPAQAIQPFPIVTRNGFVDTQQPAWASELVLGGRISPIAQTDFLLAPGTGKDFLAYKSTLTGAVWVKVWDCFWHCQTLLATASADGLKFSTPTQYDLPLPAGQAPYISGRPFRLLGRREFAQAGQHWIDGGRLYYRGPKPGDSYVTQIAGPLLKITADGVVIKGMRIEGCRGDLVQISSSGCKIQGCTIANAGGGGIVVTGTGNSINDCQVLDCGGAAVRLLGGVVKTLTRGDNVINGGHIARFARVNGPGSKAVDLYGCGNSIVGATIEDGPCTGVLIRGPLCRVAGCTIRNVANEVDDNGAIYAGRTWCVPGIVVEDNTIEDCPSRWAPWGWPINIGIYLDDAVGFPTSDKGMLVIRNNTVRRCPIGIGVFGGRGVLVDGNSIWSCPKPIRMDLRPEDVLGKGVAANAFIEQLRKTADWPTWLAAFPELAKLPATSAELKDPAPMTGTRFINNRTDAAVMFSETTGDPPGVKPSSTCASVSNNLTGQRLP